MVHRFIGALLLSSAAVQPAIAQTYPDKPIRIVVGYAAGTTTDIVARVLAGPLQKQLGQAIIVEPRPGAAGVIGSNVVVKAAPDGYTVLYGGVTGIHPIFVKNNPVDASKDLAPISDSAVAPWVMLTSAKLPINSLPDLVAYAKTKPPESLNMPTTIATQNLLMQVIKKSTGITYTSVPFTNTPQYLGGLISGEMAFHINLFGNFQQPLQAGTVRALFVMAPKRSVQYPNVPTSIEVGLTGLEHGGFGAGFWAPRGTPKAIIDKLSPAAIAAVRAPESVELYRKLGYDVIGSSPEEQLRSYETSMKFWAEAARLGNYEPQ